MASLQAIRERRQQRALRAARLTALIDGDVPGDATASATTAVMDTLTVNDLDALPAWCLLDDEPRRALQRTAGAVFLAPAVQRCIDGARLARLRERLGEPVLQAILGMRRLPSPTTPQGGDDADDVVERLDDAGAAVLLGVVPNDALRELLAVRLTHADHRLPFTVALPLYRLASDIVGASGAAT